MKLIRIIVLCSILLLGVSSAAAQEATPEATPDAPIIINVEPSPPAETAPADDSSNWYVVGATTLFAIAAVLVTIVVQITGKDKQALSLELGKSVPFELVMALLGAGVKLTETTVDDEGLNTLKQQLGITKTEVISKEPTIEPTITHGA